MLPIAERYPGTAALHSAGIAQLPTPVERLEIRGVDAELWVKRDDLTSARYGGNKVRKLDFLLGQAKAEGRRAVITFGAYGSNHALATALHARSLGIEPHVVLSPQEPGPYAPRTLLAHAALGSVVHVVEGWDGRREAVSARRELTGRDGLEPYIIPMGGTCPIGAIGYVNAAFELVGRLDPLPDVVYLAAGTLGTAVGLAIGFAAAQVPVAVEAVRVTPLEICNERIAEDLTTETVTALRDLDADFPALAYTDLMLNLRHEHFEPGYGVVTPATQEAVDQAQVAGLSLETTYTGKALAALIADSAAGSLRRRRVLFWNTYNSAPYPEPGPRERLPEVLQDYIAACERRFGPS